MTRSRLALYRPLFLLSAMVLLTLALTPGVASAHAELKSSTPSDGATVEPGLTQIVLTFSEEISVDQSSARVLDAADAPQQGVASSVDRSDRTRMTVTTPALSTGSYIVRWHVVTEDDNGITDGSLSFNVGASPDSGGSSAPQGSTPLPATGRDLWLLQAGLALLALALASTGVAVRRWAAR